VTTLRERIRAAWQGRISGCQLGKPVELLSMSKGHEGLTQYLEQADALPLRDYVPLVEGSVVAAQGRASCRGERVRSEPDDDLNYTLLALLGVSASLSQPTKPAAPPPPAGSRSRPRGA
jgi:hypothetical protein